MHSALETSTKPSASFSPGLIWSGRADWSWLAHADLDGDLYELLTPAADALDAKHPLAATLVRRAMIDFTLSAARASRYRHAARHLAECASLARRIEDFGGAPEHSAYLYSLRATHPRKAAFWQEVDQA